MEGWRLILDDAADGAWNMAVDHAVLLAHAEAAARPTLRLYRWSRPTVSIGRFQRVEDVDVDFCRHSGVGLCRRPTGGRGVLHDDELTYAIVAGVRDGLPRGVRDCYRYLSSALVAAYRSLGIEASLTPRDRGPKASACYLHATGADLCIGPAKLSGSAQVWMKESCLQHGSFVITRDVDREARAFRLDKASADALALSTATIEEATGQRPGLSQLVTALVEGVSEALGVGFEQETLSQAESCSALFSLDAYRL